MGGTLIIIVAMFALLWLLLIRPQRNRQREQQRLIDSVAPGDEILTVGGVYGIVVEEDEEQDLIVEVADGINVRVARRAVASVVKPDDEDEELAEDDADDVAGDAQELAASATGEAGEASFAAEASADAPVEEDTVKKDEETVRT